MAVLPIRTLSPFPVDQVRAAAAGCRNVLVVEEGSIGWGFAESCARALIGTPVRFDSIAGGDHPIPSSRAWEQRVLPSVEAVIAAASRLLGVA